MHQFLLKYDNLDQNTYLVLIVKKLNLNKSLNFIRDSLNLVIISFFYLNNFFYYQFYYD